MNETYRHKQLLSVLNEKKILSTNEIIDLLDISPATARRDINKLHVQGKLRKYATERKQLNQVQGGFLLARSIISPKNNVLRKLLVNFVMTVQASF